MLRLNMRHSPVMIPCIFFCIVPTVLSYCFYPDTHPVSELLDSLGVVSIFVAMTVFLFTPPYVLVLNGTMVCKWFGIRLFSIALQDIKEVHIAEKDKIRTIIWGRNPLVVLLKNGKKSILPLTDTDAFLTFPETVQSDSNAEGQTGVHALKLPLFIIRFVFIFMVILMTVLFFRIENSNQNKFKVMILIGNMLCLCFYAISFYRKNE